MIEARHIYKSLSGTPILKDISLELNFEEVTVLFGPSGGGKTTLIRSLSLLDYPDCGEITIFGEEYFFPMSKKPRIIFPYPHLTVVFQQLFLWPNLRNRDNILLALDKNRPDYSESIEYYYFLVKEMEMESYINNYPNESSLGQKQRVAIARALILNPKFIFFDEITASLDLQQVNNIVDIIFNLRKQKMGILMVTHNIQIARQIGNKLIFMENGKIIESGTKQILTNPKTVNLKAFLNHKEYGKHLNKDSRPK